MAKRGRPPGKPPYVELGLRATVPEFELIQRGFEHQNDRLHLNSSRNSFCLRAALMAAKRELGIEEESSPDDPV